MKHLHMACVAALAVAGCGDASSPDAGGATGQTAREAQRALAIAVKAAREEALEGIEAPETVVARADAGAPAMCFKDYCPCEPDIDNNAVEEGLCRSLRGGVAVEKQLMAGAAMMRDSRRELREFESRPSDY